MNLRKMLQEKDAIKNKMKGLWSKKESEKRSFSDTELNEYESLQKQSDSFDEKIKIESENLTLKRNGISDNKDFNKSVREFSISRFIRGEIFHQRNDSRFKTDSGMEQEVCAELQKDSHLIKDGYVGIPERALRATVTSAAAKGGSLIEDTVRPDQYIEGLYAESWCKKAGCTFLSGLQGDVKLPRVNAKPSVGWVQDGSAFADQSMSFNDVSLSAKFAGAIQDFSIALFYQSKNNSIENFIRRELSMALSSGVDASFINDDGTSGKPTGLLEVSGISTVDTAGANGAKMTQALLLAVEKKLLAENQFKMPVWLTNSDLMLSGRSILRFAVNGSETLGTMDRLLGHKQVVTNSVPSNGTKGAGASLSTAILFVPSSVIVGMWSGGLQISVNVLGDSYWKSGGVGIRILNATDMAVRRAKDVCSLTNIVTTL